MKFKILLVEDESIEAMNFESILVSHGFDVVGIASTGEDAIKKAADLRPDLILMDIVLKGDMDGIDAATLIREDFNIPVVYLTAHPEQSAIDRAKLTNPYGYLIKPVTKTDLKIAIELALYKFQNDTKLAESENKFQHILENSLDAAYKRNLDKDKYEYMSPVIEDILGYSVDEFISLPSQEVVELIHPQDRENVNKLFSKAFSGKTDTYNLEYRIKQKNGHYKWIVDHGSIIREGNSASLIGSVRDISQQIKTTELLRNERNKLKSILDSMLDGVYIVNKDYEIEYVNPSIEKEFGLFKGEKCYQYLHDRDDICKWCKNEEVFSGKTVKWEWTRKKTGKSYELFDIPLENPDGTISKLEIFHDITPRKNAEEAVRESEEKLRVITDNMTDVVGQMNAEGEITYFSPSLKHLTGFEPQELIDEDAMGFVHPDDLETVTNAIRELITTKKSINIEYRVLKSDGSYVWVEDNAIGIYDENGNYKSSIFSARDITDRKKAEEELKNINKALKKRGEEFRHFIDEAPFAMAMFDRDMKYVTSSHRWIEEFNLEEQELRGKYHYDIFPEINDEIREVNKRALDGLISHGEDEEFIRADGSVQYLRWEVRPWYASPDEVGGIIIFSEDVTERVQAVNALKESEEFLDNIVENIPNMIFVKNAHDLSFKRVNKEGEKYFGYSRSELIGKNDYDFFPKNIADFFTQKDRKVLQSGKLLDIPEETIETKKLGSRLLHTKKIPIKDKNGNPQYLLGISEDITERKIIEDQRKKSLKEKETLLKEIHHRVKNNLQIIRSLLDLQEGYVRDDPKAVDVLEGSKNRVMSMAMIHEMLYQSKDLSSINIHDYIRGLLITLFDSYGRRDIKSKTNVEKLYINIETAVPLGLIINELVSNSLKYAFPDNKAGEISVDLTCEDRIFKLIIKDNGVGLPEKIDLNTDSSLGLRLVQSLVNQLDGTIELDRNEGTGYKITFKELTYTKRL